MSQFNKYFHELIKLNLTFIYYPPTWSHIMDKKCITVVYHDY